MKTRKAIGASGLFFFFERLLRLFCSHFAPLLSDNLINDDGPIEKKELVLFEYQKVGVERIVNGFLRDKYVAKEVQADVMGNHLDADYTLKRTKAFLNFDEMVTLCCARFIVFSLSHSCAGARENHSESRGAAPHEGNGRAQGSEPGSGPSGLSARVGG